MELSELMYLHNQWVKQHPNHKGEGMNADLDKLYYEWNSATAELPWGVQRAFHDVFEAVRDNGTTLVYASDYSGGFPCLVNTVGTMLRTGGGHGIPMAHFSRVVSLFDQISRALEEAGVITEHGRVNALAADIFLAHFAPLKEQPEIIAEVVSVDHHNDEILTDEELEQALKDMFLTDGPVEPEIDSSYYKSSYSRD